MSEQQDPLDYIRLMLESKATAKQIAIENDLMAPPYPQLKFITLCQKMEKTQELGLGQKIGFQLSHQDKLEG